MIGMITRRLFSSSVLAGMVAPFAGTARAHEGPHSDTDDSEQAATGVTNHHIEISNFDYQPSSLRVRPGDTITWINRDIAPHTATAADDSWDTGAIRTDEAVSLEVTPDMVAAYYCRFHPMMTAELAIEIAG